MRQAYVCYVQEHIAALEIRYAAIIDVEPTAIILQKKRALEERSGKDGSLGEH